MNSFTPSSFHLISMPTSHIFVVENGVSKKVSKWLQTDFNLIDLNNLLKLKNTLELNGPY